MYLPPYFTAADDDEAYRLVDAHPFATLVATAGGAPFVSHLPLLLDRPAGGPARLLGHVARKNDQWRILRDNPLALAIFHGPQTYVTPTWYAEHDVPTWSYAVVHVRGTTRLIEDQRGLLQILARLTDRFEKGRPNPWRFELPEDLRGDALGAAIVGFEIAIESAVGKVKVGQNRSEADRAGVMQGLAGQPDEQSQAVLALMRRLSATSPM